jgi:mannose-6-phosphate isomerase
MNMTDKMPALYPLRFQEILRNYGFGGRWIVDAFEKTGLPEDHRVAETWEVVDRPNESSPIINGPLSGKTLHEAIDAYGVSLLGTDVVARCGMRFPLLIKFLDASNPLGEQIHPTDEQAPAFKRGDDPGKTEAWYMLRTRPNATIECGCKPGTDRATMEAALARKASRECMVEYPVEPDDSFLLYANAMHYSKGGVIFYEIMQNSDVTVGLNWLKGEGPTGLGKAPEELADYVHLETPFDCRTRHVSVVRGANLQTYIFACGYFSLERWDLTAPLDVTPNGKKFYVYSVIEGHATLRAGDMTEHLVSGNSFLVPATMGPAEIVPDGRASLLRAYVPDLVADVIAPLRAAGISDDHIAGLGGITRLNHLTPLLG